MKDFVVHVLEDVCVKNGRDPDAAKLIEIAKTFGSVEPLDSALAAERAKNQVVINNLTAQIDLIKEQEVTPEELEVLRALRKKSEKEGREYSEEIAHLKGQLEKVVEESESRAQAIRAILG